ncbi:GIY-YIG nuclease family protein [Flavobacterium sp. SOK18b]|uniref:GIY-YIG nuclease family protein n=1 Tax=Flavobacterium sp. SOK18b TaxID=797900 RepID=UPI0015FCAE1A|nr:GIY-YIG nuclease family protein [Flavobacterium sp. SOK18b]MBB1192634.1 GIY-YIG nuclease family protein [Flavobacterium sp. SOK18b]
MQKGFVYILTNKNHTILYIGVTKDLKKRMIRHINGNGAAFTKKYNATILIYFEEFEDYKNAFVREKQLKNWHKEWKLNLIKLLNPKLKDLYLSL